MRPRAILVCCLAAIFSVPSFAQNQSPVRTGVQPLGGYWGALGESIDLLSGNLNYSIPLVHPRSRGWGLVLGLTYNSQNFRTDGSTETVLAKDLGYGFGWRLQFGSIAPVAGSNPQTYAFIDASGAQYALTPSTPSGTFVETQGLHILYNANTQVLTFVDGTKWSLGSVSASGEPDKGTRYPTLITDTNGNTITVTYMTGLGGSTANTSGRIAYVEDVRAVINGSQRITYTFGYDSETLPHLESISNSISSGESYTFGYAQNQPLNNPICGLSYGTTDLLSSIAIGGTPLTYQFSYAANNAAELTSVALPHGGAIAWAYRSFTFAGSHTIREVDSRELTAASGGTPVTYAITHNDSADAGYPNHSETDIADPSGTGYKTWLFDTDGTSAPLGALLTEQERNSQSSAVLVERDYTWATDSGGTPYVSAVVTTLDPASNQKQSKVTYTQDGHGNTTQVQYFDFGNLTTPVRTYTNQFLTSSTYTQNWIWNRIQSSTVSNGSQSVTLFTNTYDGTSPSPVSGLNEWTDPGTPYRGNLTSTSRPWDKTNVAYDATGQPTSTDDGCSHSLLFTPESGSNDAVAGNIAPNGSSTLSTNYAYDSALRPQSTTGPNGNTSSATFDSAGRLAMSTSEDGAQTSYSYTYNPSTITATTNTHWVRRTLDGLGRVVKIERGNTSGTTVSAQDITYAPSSTHPLGLTQSVSRPYQPGNTSYTTQYSYDGRGRTTKIVQPANTGTNTFGYSGNNTTVTDAAGKTKTYTHDSLHHLTQVTEPDPQNPTKNTLLTTHTYDLLDRMTTVSMTRNGTTQTRTFSYDPTTQRLTSVQRPENGKVTYSYNSDNTLASRTDAKGQKVAYSYDSLARVTTVKRYPNGTTEDTCQRDTYSYDSNPYDSTYTQNGIGRLNAVQYGGTGCKSGTLFTEMHSYTPPGRAAGKRLRLNRGNNNADLNAAFTYNNQGQMATKSYPNGGPTYTYGFDSMGRAVSLTDNNGQSWVNTEIYGPDDQPIKMNIYNGSSYWTETRGYDPRGQLKTQSVPGVMDMTYVHSSSNDNGQITQSIDNITGQTVNYTYDSLRRLSAATTGSTGPWAFSFSYDGFGNRTAETLIQGKGPSVTLGYDSTTNHISSTGFGYDGNGNLSNMPNGITLGYDAENRLSSYYDPNQGTEFYGYGPQNHRVWKKEPSGNEEIHFFAPNGTHLGTYKPVLTGSTLSLQTIDTDLHYVNRSIRSRGNMVFRDRLGSVRAWGTTVTHSYFPFGEEQTATTSDHDKFATYYRDTTTGIDFARNRYYNSTYGAFLTADPYGGSARAGNPGSWNRYTYAGNDPVNTNDPSGMEDPNGFASSSCSDPQILALCQAGDFWDYTGGSIGVYGPASVGGTPTSEPSGDPFGQSPEAPDAGPVYVPSGGVPTFTAEACAYCNANPIIKALVWLNSAIQPAVPVLNVLNQTGNDMMTLGMAMLPGAGAAANAGTAAVEGAATAATSYVFYSGPGAQEAAEAWSAANNGTMIGATQFGQAIENGTMTAEEASQAFANSASGTAQVFSNDPFTNYGNVWYNYELPALANNPNVTNVVFNPVPNQ